MAATQGYDVIVLGSGIGGSTIAAVLARHGFRVLMLDKARHPRFALGEATLPQTSYWMWLISERYGIPELKNLADSRLISSAVAPSSGIKRSLGFVYHRTGREQDIVNESHQMLPPELPFVSESHFYREDIDLYMVDVARRHGAELRENVDVNHFDIEDGGVCLRDAEGTEYQARYLVDASGYNSIVSRTFDAQERPTRLRTRSRSIFTHLEGMRPYDELFTADKLPGYKYRWHDGTLHHVFDGGWFWIIPFDNHDGSCNGRASVGVTLDMEKFPMRDDITPEEEFNQIVARYPTIARHLEGTAAVRPYVRTGRLQYSCSRAAGERFFITPQAYGAVDALYSRGMISTFEMIYTFAGRLIDALRRDDLSAGQFADLDGLARRQLDMHDAMVAASYKAFADFDTWSAWLKVWLASKIFGDLWLFRTCMRFMATGDRAVLDSLDMAEPPYADEMRAVFDRAVHLLDEAEANRITRRQAAEGIVARLAECDWLPHHTYGFGKTAAHHADLTAASTMPLVILWGKTRAPKWMRRGVFDFPVGPLAKMQIREKLGRKRGQQ